jgi:hypothetical protein
LKIEIVRITMRQRRLGWIIPVISNGSGNNCHQSEIFG